MKNILSLFPARRMFYQLSIAGSAQVRIGEPRVIDQHLGSKVGSEPGLHRRKLLGKPNIILVGKENEVASTERSGMLEIARVAEVLRIAVDKDRERCGPREPFRDLQRLVARAVIADDELIGQPRLGRKASSCSG